jgi:hypothetical protein
MRDELTMLRSRIAETYNGSLSQGCSVAAGMLVEYMRTLDDVIKGMPEKVLNARINPETKVSILLAAEDIPNGSRVTKRGGEVSFVLKHKLTIYPVANDGSKPGAPMVVDGFFLVNPGSGEVNQVKASQPLLWRTTAEGFVDAMKESWRGVEQ